MAWRELWGILVGDQLKDDEFLSPLTASITFLSITIGSGIILRVLNNIYSPEWCKSYIADFLATMEMCAYFFENNFIFKYYGSVCLFVAIVIECMIANRTYFGASENPCKAFVELCKKEISPNTAILKISIQTLAGYASYRFARMIWALDMISDHRERYVETECATDLNVTFLVGIMVELGASLIDTWLNMQNVSKMSLIDEFIKVGNGSLMIVLGINLTGMYFNPAMAFGHMFGCKGTAMWEHFVVYWIGPFIGSFLALTLDNMLHIDVTKPQIESKKTK